MKPVITRHKVGDLRPMKDYLLYHHSNIPLLQNSNLLRFTLCPLGHALSHAVSLCNCRAFCP